MPTVQEILKQSGFSDDQIAALDAKAVTAFGTVLTTAEQDRKTAAELATKAETERKAAADAQTAARAELEKVELQKRANVDWYEGTVVKALTGWEDEKKQIESARAQAAAEAAFYKTQAEQAKSSGFIPKEAPVFTPTPVEPPPARDGNGRYVSSVPGGTPGSPTLVDDVRSALSDSTWAMREYQSVVGGFLPDDITVLAAEANSQKLPFRDYVARKYDFTGKRAEKTRLAQEAHDNEVRAAEAKTWEEKLKAKEEEAKVSLEKARQDWAERSGSNPAVKTALPSQMQEVKRAVQAGDRPDPLKMSNIERHQITRKQINERITSQEAGAA